MSVSLSSDRQRTRKASLLLLLAIAILCGPYFAIRWSAADDLVTNDEPFWLGRSANFSRAMTYQDFDHTYQMAHPGVPVMWAGAIAFWFHEPGYTAQDMGNTEWPFFIDDRLADLEIDPLTILREARLIKLLLETVLFAFAVFLVANIGTWSIALGAGILISFDPFLAGFGPLLHVDSLFAISLFAATLAAIWAFQPKNDGLLDRRKLSIAGVLAAIAVLTRMTGLVIAAPLVLLSMQYLFQSESSWRRRVPSLLGGGITWLFSLLATFLVAWPAVWISPISTLQKVIEWTFGAASGGHEHALFFEGEILNNDPGFWFYPVTLLWRTTPLAWVGLALFVIGVTSPRLRELSYRFLPVFVLGAMVLVIMTVGAKKFDRYILPLYPVISLAASLGFCWLYAELQRRYATVSKWIALVGIVAIFSVSTASLVDSGRYHLNYYNPIMQLVSTPEDAIQIGWGEGGSEVIDFLKSESKRLDRPITAQTFSIPKESIPPPLKYFLYEDEELTGRINFENQGLNTAEDWIRTDYYVFNIQQTQRDMVSDYYYFSEYSPAFTVTIGGVVIWEVFAVSELPIPDSIGTAQSPDEVTTPIWNRTLVQGLSPSQILHSVKFDG